MYLARKRSSSSFKRESIEDWDSGPEKMGWSRDRGLGDVDGVESGLKASWCAYFCQYSLQNYNLI